MVENTRIMVKTAVKALEDKKASDISVIDISDLSVVADCFIIASADNIRQTKALYDNVEEVMGRAGFTMRQSEGVSAANWILMDYNDVIIHIFDKENRLFYDIERIWKDGKKILDIDSL
ncbi:MAG: ribosome silencing factor [Eubacteriales bacterium]|nr:ribosome silencing factor [Eubacteriales bacterium]